MKFNYKLRRVCGAYYGHPISTDTTGACQRWSGSNLVYDESGFELLSAVANRIQVLDLQSHTVRTLPVEARSSITRLALHDNLLLVVDSNNHAMLVNYHVGVVLHRFQFQKGRVRDLQFSPLGGHFLAVSQGSQCQVWCTPRTLAARKEFAPMILLRTYTGQSDDVTCLTWSSDATVLAAGSRDCTVRLWTRETTRHFVPQTLAGHKRPIVGLHLSAATDDDSVSNSKNQNAIRYCYSISQDGAMVTWKTKYSLDPNDIQQQQDDDSDEDNDDNDQVMQQDGDEDDAMAGDDSEAVDFFTGGGDVAPRRGSKTTRTIATTNKRSNNNASQAHHLVHATWSIKARHYLSSSSNSEGGGGGGNTHVTCTTFCPRAGLLAVGFASGLFGIYQLDDVSNIHTLSVGSNQLVQACVLNTTGDWLALACPMSQQLLVWEWKSETYVLKQRGHAYGMRCMAYSPDGIVICTGGEDGKIKLWNATSGFCYVTLEKTHTAPITAIAFGNPSVVLSASLDGTVRAHDLHRYRTFKTLTTPTPVQFLSLAVDPSGEVVAAGSADPFHVYCWNLQTGKLLDVLTGHAGPVCDLQFASAGSTTNIGSMLVSASWDGTVKLWDIYKTNVPSESLQHLSDVVCVAVRPDGQEICTGTVSGILHFWDVASGKLSFEIDGRRDVAGGRKMNDRRTADNNASSRYFTSVCYSADGLCVLAGGNSKYVCIYHVQQQMLLKKFQVTFNRSLDGVLDELNSKNLGPGGPMDDHFDPDEDETTYNALNLPGARRGDDGSRASKVEVLTMQVAFSSTGREWSTISGEGLHVYSLDDDMIFDPISLQEAITPAAVLAGLAAADYGPALVMALHLNESALVKQVLEETPYASITHVVRTAVSTREHLQLERLLQIVGKAMADSPHVEFYLQWILQLLQTHGLYMEKHRGRFMRAFRAIHKAVQTRYSELKTISDENRYSLAFVQGHAQLVGGGGDANTMDGDDDNGVIKE